MKKTCNLYFRFQILSKNYTLERKVLTDLKPLNFPAILCCTSLNNLTGPILILIRFVSEVASYE